MRLTFILILLGCLQASARALGQKVFTIDMSHVKVENVLSKIQEESDYRFFYNERYLNHLNPVSIKVTDARLPDIMHHLLDSTLTYKIIENNLVVISPKEAISDQHKISGIVMDSKGNPLVGVTVQVQGTTNGTVTDAQGKFTLVVPDNAILVVSSIGFQTQNIKTGNKTTFTIQLKASASGLNEVVVVGYGTQKKVDLTGAVTQIGNKMLQDRPVDNVGQALQGVVPNLNINFSDGRPGAPAQVNIRGFTSVNGGEPLVLIDGVPGDINLVNPLDIKTVTVLKGAAAAAVYGARAAYGVILITTKSGTPGKMRVTYSANFSMSTPTTSHDFLTNGYEYGMLVDSAFGITVGRSLTGYTSEDYAYLKSRLTNPSLPDVVIKNVKGRNQFVPYGNTDWWHYYFSDWEPAMSHNIQFSGGSDKVTYMISGRYYQQKGLTKFLGDKYTAYNLRAKVDAHINSWLTIDNNLQFAANSYTWPGSRPVDQIFQQLGVALYPSEVPVNPDGTFAYLNNLTPYGMAGGYGLELQSEKSKSEEQNYDMTNTFTVTLQPTPHLTIVGSYSYDLNPARSFNRSVITPWSVYPGVISYTNNDTYSETTDLDQYHVVNAFATYQNSFGLNSLKIMAGYNQELKKYYEMDGSGNNLLSQDLNALDLATSGQVVGSNQVQWALLGFFSRINYNYKDKYLLELDGRYDGSSHFPQGKRFGFFPSISAGWRVSEEPFFKPVKPIINELKLRGSYGALGNQSLSTNLRADDYPYIPLMNTGLSDWLINGNKSQYLDVGNPVSPELTWERTQSADVGIDMDLLNDRLSVTFDWYDRKTLGMLVPGPTLPGVFGATSPTLNAGNLDTKGWGLSVSWRNSTQLAGKTFSYSAGVVLSNFKSYITKFNNPTKLLSNYYNGERIGEIWGFMVDGYFKTDQEAKEYTINQDFVDFDRLQAPGAGANLQAGDLKFKDLDGNDTINEGQNTFANHGDLKVLGNSLPQYSFGVNGSASWNGFDISVFFQGVGVQDWYPGPETYVFWGPYGRPYYSFIPKNFPSQVWSPQNPNSYFPKLRGYNAIAGRALAFPDNKYLQSIAYVRLKNLTIGYNLPQSVLEKLKADEIRIYLTGENIFTLSPLQSKYIDPEQVSTNPNGVIADDNARNYPFMKSYSFGIDVTF